MVGQIAISVLIILLFAIGVLFILFPKYIKAKIDKKKNYEIRLYGIVIIILAIIFYFTLSIISSLLNILKNLVEVGSQIP